MGIQLGRKELGRLTQEKLTDTLFRRANDNTDLANTAGGQSFYCVDYQRLCCHGQELFRKISSNGPHPCSQTSGWDNAFTNDRRGHDSTPSLCHSA